MLCSSCCHSLWRTADSEDRRRPLAWPKRTFHERSRIAHAAFHFPLRRYVTPQWYIFCSGSSCTYAICAGTKRAWSPGEYGTATSISIFSKYSRALLKRRPPREMSSHATTSSGNPGRRTQAFKVTRVRPCFRRFSCSFTAAARASGAVAAGDFAFGTPAGSLGGVVSAFRSGAAGAIGSSVGTVSSGFVQAAPPNADGRSAATLGRLPSRHDPGASGGSERTDKSSVSSPDLTPNGTMCSAGVILGG